jgi:colanic acid biosynthesis glycosyl transferase WcaI
VKILLYGINFAPELTGIGKYTGELAAWLAAHGHEVRVVTAPPYYPAWAVSPGYSGRAYQTERWQGVTVLRCPLWVPRQPGGAKRLLHLASFALSSLPVLLAQVLWRPNLVWVVEPALFCAPAAVAVARLSGAKAWLHVQDFEVDAAFDLGLLKGQRLRKLVAGVERWLMRRFDVVSTISQRMHQRLLAKGVDASKAKLAVNWVDMAQFAQPSADGMAAYRQELNIPQGAVVALYSGNMGGKQGLEILAQVAKLCQVSTPDLVPNVPLAHVEYAQPAINTIAVVFVFCGAGAGRADLLARCQGLPNVRFMDLQPADRLPDLLGMADIHLLPQRADAADLVMPSKLTGMLASARPVVATAHFGTELATVVQTCGLVVPPEDPAALAQAVRTLAADPALRQQLGAAGHTYALAHLDRDAVLQKFEADALALL